MSVIDNLPMLINEPICHYQRMIWHLEHLVTLTIPLPGLSLSNFCKFVGPVAHHSEVVHLADTLSRIVLAFTITTFNFAFHAALSWTF